MARTSFWGFETNDGASGLLEFTSGTNATFDTAVVRSGTYSGKITLASAANGSFNPQPVVTTGYLRMYCLFSVRPVTTQRRFYGSTGAGQINLRLNSTGTIQMYQGTTSVGTSTTACSDTGRWYRIEIRQPNGSSVPVLLIDGVVEVTGSPSSWALSSPFGSNDSVADVLTMYFDDIAYDDTGFPGEGKVVLLKPISDNARAALWTGGTGGTTNLFDAVNNTPPIGTATETNTSQIEHAGGAAGSTDAYDANMTSYESAGIRPFDTINAISMMAVDGEDSGTGSKLLAYSVVSNPAIASPGNVTAGDDVGALGTYPNTWAGRVHRGITNNPAVTINTSPVMRVVRPETAARVASVCFMGLYVEYTPSPMRDLPKARHYPQLLAH